MAENNRAEGGENEPLHHGGLDAAKIAKEKDDLVKYMSNGNKTKLMTSGLLNTAALSTNASLLAVIIKLERMDATALIALCLILLSVLLQITMAIFTLLEYRAMLMVDRDPEKLWRKRELRRKTPTTSGGAEKVESYSFCKPMEMQFLVALCTVFLTVVNTFVIALTSNLHEELGGGTVTNLSL